VPEIAVEKFRSHDLDPRMMAEYANGDHWTLDDIPLDRVEIGRVRAREELFLLLAGASFVETASDLYTRNLTAQFHGDTEVSSWLTRRWEPEELQHGRALRAYVNQVWPDFDWQTAFSEFLAEHSRYCIAEELESSPCLEMAARCVVEMGTATYYRAIQSISDEPVLQGLAGHIQRDEVRHYEHFHRFFHLYNERERNGRARVLGALARRLQVILRSDVKRGAWFPYRTWHTHASRNGREFRRAMARTTALMRRHYPAPMAIKMLLKPLALPPAVNRLSYGTVKLAQRMILR
jgi:hypothetical protein